MGLCSNDFIFCNLEVLRSSFHILFCDFLAKAFGFKVKILQLSFLHRLFESSFQLAIARFGAMQRWVHELLYRAVLRPLWSPSWSPCVELRLNSEESFSVLLVQEIVVWRWVIKNVFLLGDLWKSYSWRTVPRFSPSRVIFNLICVVALRGWRNCYFSSLLSNILTLWKW